MSTSDPSDPRKRGPRPTRSAPLDLEAQQIADRVRSELFGTSPRTTVRYEIRRKLGVGGMGVVYEAYDPVLDCLVALKQLRPGLSDDGRLMKQLHREAQMMAKLRGERHIVTLFDFFKTDAFVCVVMELVEGKTLRTFQTADRGWQAVLEKYMQAGEGLAAAHRAGLIHRDFKAENVLIDARGLAKVSDFGLARVIEASLPAGVQVDGAKQPATTTIGAAGTPLYMPPELIEGERCDARSDQFSFCVSLYEALYEAHPLLSEEMKRASRAATGGAVKPEEQPATDDPFIVAIRRAEVRPPPRGTNVPEYLLATLRRGMARRPAQRFSGMEELLAALGDDPRRRRWSWAAFSTVVIGAALGGMAMCEPLPPPPTAAEISQEKLDDLERGLAFGREDPRRSRQSDDTSKRAEQRSLLPLREHLIGKDGSVRSEMAVRTTRVLHDIAERSASTYGELKVWERDSPGLEYIGERLACLGEIDRSLVDFADGLRRADSPDLPRALEAVLAQPEPGSCASLPVARLVCLREAMGEERIVGESNVLEDMREAARAEAAGDYEQALVSAARADDAARRLSMPILRGRAGYLYGRLLYEVGRPDAAVAALEAARDAVQPTGCLELRADIASRLVKVTALSPSLRVEPARVWAREQMALAYALGQKSRMADAHNELGLLASFREDDPHRAAREFRRAIELRKDELGGRPSVQQADSYLNLGKALLDLHVDGAARHADLVAGPDETRGAGSETRGAVESKRGAAEFVLARSVHAEEWQENADGESGSARGVPGQHNTGGDVREGRRGSAGEEFALTKSPISKGTDLIEAWRVRDGSADVEQEDRGETESAELLAETRGMFFAAMRERAASLGPDHPLLYKDYFNLGLLLQQAGARSGARLALEEALKLAGQRFGRESGALASVLNALAEVERDSGRFDEAAELARRAAESARAARMDPVERFEIQRASLELRFELTNEPEVLAELESLLEESAIVDLDPDALWLTHLNLGELLRSVGELERARHHVERASSLLDRPGASVSETDRIEMSRIRGSIHYAADRFELAIADFEEALGRSVRRPREERAELQAHLAAALALQKRRGDLPRACALEETARGLAEGTAQEAALADLLNFVQKTCKTKNRARP